MVQKTKKARKVKSTSSAAAESNVSIFFERKIEEAFGIVLILLSVFLFFSFLSISPIDPSFNHAATVADIQNKGGIIGAYLSDLFILSIGVSAFIIPFLTLALGINVLRGVVKTDFWISFTLLPFLFLFASSYFTLSDFFGTWPEGYNITNGGLIGSLSSHFLVRMFGMFGAYTISFVFFVLTLFWVTGITFTHIKNLILISYDLTKNAAIKFKSFVKKLFTPKNIPQQIDLPLLTVKKQRLIISQPKDQKEKPKSQKVAKQASLPIDITDGSYVLPNFDLLDENTQNYKGASEADLTQNARQIEIQLANYGVKGEVVSIKPGPVITIYELEPAPGVKTSQVINLSDDLARAMSAKSVRIAPIPGTTVLGIEMPNIKRKMVTLKELLKTEAFEFNNSKLAIALGATSSGEPAYADINAMPHALIAGTTGSGKSVAVNAFIISLLYKMPPDKLKFLMIDPKMLELSIYNDIPHLLTPVITDAAKASTSLKWVVNEMEKRYKLMSELGVKNIQSFNTHITKMIEDDNIPNIKVPVGFDPMSGELQYELQPIATSTLPYIVVIIDELADLMMVAGKDVEQSIARIAQKARAAGIHLLVATQRPSVDVITGLIKANIPTRMSFNVTSRIDSRTILDSMGAEQLLGMGDMLYMANGQNNLQRLHGAFVSEEECQRVAEFIRSQSKPEYLESIFNPTANSSGSQAGQPGRADEDPLYKQAVNVIAREQKVSTSFVQRYLQIGYNRAARIIEQMEQDGYISEPQGAGKREVIIKVPLSE